MLDKNLMNPGSFVTVGDPKTGVPSYSPGEKNSLDAVRVMGGAGSILDGHYKAPKGTVLEIVKGPKKIEGINVAMVKFDDGTQGYVYWTELRQSCFHSDRNGNPIAVPKKEIAPKRTSIGVEAMPSRKECQDAALHYVQIKGIRGMRLDPESETYVPKGVFWRISIGKNDRQLRIDATKNGLAVAFARMPGRTNRADGGTSIMTLARALDEVLV